MRAGKDCNQSAGCTASSTLPIVDYRKSGVLFGSLSFEPRLAQQLRYPLRCDRHFKDTDAKRCQRIGNSVEYRPGAPIVPPSPTPLAPVMLASVNVSR